MLIIEASIPRWVGTTYVCRLLRERKEVENKVGPATTASIVGFDDRGGGTPLVLLHGYPLSRAMWTPQLGALAAYARLIVPDLPGFGASAAARPAASIAGMAAAAAGLLDRLGVERAVIGGLSMGGYVALAFARACPERLLGLILADTSARPDSPERRRDRDLRAAALLKDGLAAFAPQTVAPYVYPRTVEQAPELARQLAAMAGAASVEGIVAALAAMRDRPDARPWLPFVRVPTLIIVGEEDRITPPELSREMAGSLTAPRTLCMIPGAGHISNLDAVDAFNAAVRGFLQSLAV